MWRTIVFILALAGLVGALWLVAADSRGESRAEVKVMEGTKAPDFKAPSSGGREVSLADYRGKVVVLYFYPKDDTPGCTYEARSFRDASDEFARLGVVVIGVSRDSVESHDKFVSKYDLGFALVSDGDGSVMDAYGVWKERSIFGRSALGVSRSTFVIDGGGVVRKVWRDVSVKGHTDEVLGFIKANLVKG